MNAWRINIIWLGCNIIFFNIIGIFGNVNLIWSTVRKAGLRSKHGILLSLHAFCSIVCLLSEFVDAYFIFDGKPFTRRECYRIIFFHIFFVTEQMQICLLICCDLIFAILMATRYRVIHNGWYILAITSFTWCISAGFSAWGYVMMDDELIPFCGPPQALHPLVSAYWSQFGLTVALLTVLAYVMLLILVCFRASRHKNSSSYDAMKECRRVIIRIRVVMIAYLCSWFMAMLGVNLAPLFGLSEEGYQIFRSNMLIFALMCSTQNFYVCIWRSHEYKNAFREQLQIISCRYNKPSNGLFERRTNASKYTETT